MSPHQALLLGLVQGLTEFLPLSSSGHLVLFEQLLGFQTPPIAFDSLTHVATLAAVLVYFRHQLSYFFRQKLSHIIVGTIPAIIVGFFIYKFALGIFADLYLLSFGFLATSLLLVAAHNIHTPGVTVKGITHKQSFFIGLFQALAILPSISRSGATFAAGRYVGLSKEASFTFSFLLSIPAIIGALTLTGPELFTATYPPLPSIIGFSAAFLFGFLSLKLLDYMVRRTSLKFFIWYTFIFGVFLLGLTN